MNLENILNKYTPVGDNITLILCIVLIMLKKLTYSKKDKKLEVFTWAIDLLLIASCIQLFHYVVLENIGLNLWTLSSKIFYYLCLTCVCICYCRYIIESFDLKKNEIKLIKYFGAFPGVVMQLITIIYMFFMIIKDINIKIITLELLALKIFMYTYLYYIFFLILILCLFKNRIIKKLFKAFVFAATFSVIIMIVSTIREDISFLTFTFILPLLSAYNLLHNNPFNIELGALDANAFENYLFDLKDKKTKFTLVCIYLENTKNKEYIKTIRNELNTTYSKIVEKSYLFKINDNKFILVIKNKQIDYKKLGLLKITLDNIYDKFKIDYKLTIIPSSEILNENKSYIKFNKYLEEKMKNNSICFADQEDLILFMKNSYIINQLHDINKKNNLEDERILIYCQPVFNITDGTYDSAEALMRLNLPETGIIFPDLFIPLAEKEKCIHSLSKIILNKACQFIKNCNDNNMEIKRISVNFSIEELKEKNFCKDIIDIISSNKIPFNNIAIELTESKNEQDLDLIKEKIKELKNLGIYFYLDDFGTGYSNLDRIMQLPIDIIKFDRSLVLLSGKDNRYQHTIKGFSSTFEALGYKILFEGIENEQDENMCINMKANYLQGYKYSKPIPIKELENFLTKKPLV